MKQQINASEEKLREIIVDCMEAANKKTLIFVANTITLYCRNPGCSLCNKIKELCKQLK